MVADLESLAREHDQKANEHQREAERYRAAAALLREDSTSGLVVRHPRPRVDGRRPEGGTMSLAIKVLRDLDTPASPSELVELMKMKGWRTSSTNPTNTLRTALRRMLLDKTSGVRVDAYGRYYYSE